MEFAPILIGEDDPQHADLIKTTLELARLGNPLVLLPDGSEVVSYLERFLHDGRGEPALVLLDLHLPRRSGLDVLQWMKSRPDVSHIPVVMLTSSRDAADINQAYDLGVSSYLVKPVGFDALLEVVKGLDLAWVLVQDPSESVVDRYRLQTDLQLATERSELVLHYQPVVEIGTGRLIGVEALVRWQHPERGLLPPFVFIELAEEIGAIHDLGRWTLQEAVRQTLEWERSHGVALEIAVNLSPVQLENPQIAGLVGDVLDDLGFDPQRVMLEVTEGALMREPEEMITRLGTLKSSGVRLAIDDFGTGYSSLSYLRRLPIDVVKVDRAFVGGIARESEEFALASAIVRLAQTLGKTTLAEGIELPEQLAHLRALKCHLGQGYFFSKPLPPDELAPLLTADRWPTPL